MPPPTHLMTKCLKSRLLYGTGIALLSIVLATGTILFARLQAQTTGSGSGAGSASASSSSSVSFAPAPMAGDTPPTISLAVLSANPAVAGFRPGVRAYYSTTITDDTSLKSVVITTSQMMYSSSTNDMYACAGKTFCEEKVYIIVPANAGAQFVTVTAIDSAGQITTKTVTFNADACSTDADCGGGAIQWAGASYCGSEAGGLETDIMQYGVAAICKSGGICDTSSLPRVKQKCAEGQVCTFSANGMNLCIAKPNACTSGAQITSVCTCGNSTLNYPYDWRVNTPTFCCSVNGSPMTYGGSTCPAPMPSTPIQGTYTSPAAPRSATGSAMVQTSPRTASAAILSVPGNPSPTPTAPWYSTSSPSLTPLYTTAPGIAPVRTGSASLMPQPAMQWQQNGNESVRPLTKSQLRTLSSRKKTILRELIVLQKTLKQKRNKDALAHLEELRADVKAFEPVDASAYETILDFQDEVAELRLRAAAKKAVRRAFK